MWVVKKLKIMFLVLCKRGMTALLCRVVKSCMLRWCCWRGHKLNFRCGWRSKQLILVIESDDWGAEHIPGAQVIEQMKGTDFFPKDLDIMLDGLETADDVDRLCSVLNCYRDSSGNPAVITANFVMANPDFSAIRESNYSVFKAKPIDTGWNHEPNSAALWRSYRDGIRSGLIVPQLHGMLHFCPDEWLKRLRQGDPTAMSAFDAKMIGENSDASALGRQSMGPIYHTDDETIKELIEQGTKTFKRVFGMGSITTVAPCCVWRSPQTEGMLLSCNVRVMQGVLYQYFPGGRMKLHYMGERDPSGMFYTVRNCMLEPKVGFEQCVSQIEKSFQFGLPAVISSHRLNYTSRISSNIRDNRLAMLNRVLEYVTTKFPNVQFLSSDNLALRILEENCNL